MASTRSSSPAPAASGLPRSEQAARLPVTLYDGGASTTERALLALLVGALSNAWLSSDMRFLMLLDGIRLAKTSDDEHVERQARVYATRIAAFLSTHSNGNEGFMG